MKKSKTGIIKLFIIVIAILLICSNLLTAQISVSLPTLTEQQGSAPEWINVTAGNLTGQNVKAFQFTLTYDKSVIYIDSAICGPVAT